jgi:hypothetical protein
LPLADTGTRAATRVLAIYSLGGRLRIPADSTRSLAGNFDLGRFAHHVEATASLLPRVTAWAGLEPGQFGLASGPFGVRLGRVAAAVAITPRRDGLLFLDIELAGQPDAAAVAEFLHVTWRRRSELRVGETALLGWLAGRFGQVRTDEGQPLTFGQNLHQCVFAGGRLARGLLRRNRKAGTSSPDVVAVVFRGTMSVKRGTDLGIQRPVALNNPGETMVAHGRGVSLMAGWAEPVENAFAIAATGLVNAAGVVTRVRLQSLEALRVNEASAARSAPEIRALIADLSDRLDQLRLDLSFGIEAYADVVLIPELLVESYHSSLRRVAALAESTANTSRIVDRVAAVIDARHTMLSASVQAYTERRDKILAGAIAIGSLLALPPTLLLAYFGTNSTNVNQHLSIFDVRHYGIAYLVAWLPFVALVGGAAVMRRRIQPAAPKWHGTNGADGPA